MIPPSAERKCFVGDRGLLRTIRCKDKKGTCLTGSTTDDDDDDDDGSCHGIACQYDNCMHQRSR